MTCGEWNTLQEEAVIVTGASKAASKRSSLQIMPAKLASTSQDAQRIQTSITDVDAVLGGGLVSGSVSLIAGQPGIGKSTLLLQIAAGIAKKYSVLYVSGEESSHQIGLRA